jgi:hypothetical protein
MDYQHLQAHSHNEYIISLMEKLDSGVIGALEDRLTRQIIDTLYHGEVRTVEKER